MTKITVVAAILLSAIEIKGYQVIAISWSLSETKRKSFMSCTKGVKPENGSFMRNISYERLTTIQVCNVMYM